MALLLALPVRPRSASPRTSSWIRAALVAALLAVAVVGIAGTDLQPCQDRTGVAAVDKVWAILDVFGEKVLQRGTACGHTRQGPHGS